MDKQTQAYTVNFRVSIGNGLWRDYFNTANCYADAVAYLCNLIRKYRGRGDRKASYRVRVNSLELMSGVRML